MEWKLSNWFSYATIGMTSFGEKAIKNYSIANKKLQT